MHILFKKTHSKGNKIYMLNTNDTFIKAKPQQKGLTAGIPHCGWNSYKGNI
jgi:hypothetical protein